MQALLDWVKEQQAAEKAGKEVDPVYVTLADDTRRAE